MSYPPPKGLRSRASVLWPFLLLTALGLLFFADQVLHPGQVLYSDHSDFWSFHLPAKHYLNRSWHETGELALWCPYRYAGTPFIHDIQVGAFYPLHLPFYVLPESAVGPVHSWLIVMHVLLAGWGMYGYALSRSLNVAGSLVAALGFMFAGRWLLHVLAGGHYITVGLAWIPVVLLLFEQSLHGGGLRWAVGAGVAYALLILSTHPQWTFYASLFIGMWTLAIPLEKAGFLDGGGQRSIGRALKELGRWLGLGTVVVLVAVGLSAVQLLPTAEAAALSSRASGVGSGPVLERGLWTLRSLVGPAVSTVMHSLEWEERGGLCMGWLAAAGMAPWLCPRKRVRFQAGVCLVMFLYALGGAVLVQDLPGFRLFRQPARMFLVAGFPVAYLTGVTTHVLSSSAATVSQSLRSRCRQVLLAVAAIVSLLVIGFVFQLWREGVALRFHAYWPSLLLTVPALYWLLGKDGAAFRRHEVWAAAWTSVLLVDLWALIGTLVAVRPEAAIFEPSACVHYLETHSRDHGRVLDRDVPGDSGTPLGVGATLAMLHQLEALRGYTPLDVLRYKEYLQFIGDADQPLRSLDHPLVYPVMADFPVRNLALLDLLGVRYLLQAATQPLAWPGWSERLVDPDARAYDFVAGGSQPTGAYAVYENPAVMPRAFVVPEAAPLPERAHVMEALKHTDFRRRVLLDGWSETVAASVDGEFRKASIRDYRPNRITIDVPEGGAGFLVLTDVWYPGWRCRVDGEPATIWQANFLFRAVPVAAGTHEVVFTFEPDSYRHGRTVSGVASGLVALVLLVPLLRPRRHREGAAEATPSAVAGVDSLRGRGRKNGAST